MAATYNPDQQPYPPLGQGAYAPPGQGAYPPPGQGAYPLPEQAAYPPQAESAPFHQYPQKQGDLPPSYDYKPPPITTTASTVVVAAQPTTTTTYASPQTNGSDVLITCALVFSIITLACCGTSLFCLICIIPAFVLAIRARGTTGSEQKNSAAISIALNVAVVACCVLFLVTFIPAVIFIPAVSVSSSRSYYRSSNSYYRTYRYYNYNNYYYYG